MDAHKKAVTSMVLGIIGTALSFFGYSAIISVVLGIIGLVMANHAKKEGEQSGIRTAGFVLSLISLVFGAVIFIGAIALVGAVFSIIGNLI